MADRFVGPNGSLGKVLRDAHIAGLKEARELLHRQEPWMLVGSFKASLDNRIAELEKGSANV